MREASSSAIESPRVAGQSAWQSAFGGGAGGGGKGEGIAGGPTYSRSIESVCEKPIERPGTMELRSVAPATSDLEGQALIVHECKAAASDVEVAAGGVR